MLTKTQTLILWAILASPQGGAFQKDVRPPVSKSERDALVKAGLISGTKRGRGLWLEVTDKGWSFAQENLDAELPARTTVGATVLHAWLLHLKAYLAAENLALADIMAPRSARDSAPDLRKAYLAVTGGVLNQRVRLKDFRARLAGVGRAALDEALTEAHAREGLHLSGSDNPPELAEADHAAALDFKGERMHFLWITR